MNFIKQSRSSAVQTSFKYKVFVLAACLSSINLYANSVLACTVYWNPRIKGLEVDRCISSYLYPEGCSGRATKRAADLFCQRRGHRNAKSWEWQDQDINIQRNVYKLLEESGSSYFRVQKGSFVFTGILCRD